MRIETLENADFFSNTYLLSLPGYSGIVVIDPGIDYERLMDKICTDQLVPEYILLTHEHFDHIRGTEILKASFPDCKIVCSLSCSERIVDARLNLSFFKNTPYESPAADVVVNWGDIIEWKVPIACYPFEGHSPGGTLFFAGPVLFCGDQFIRNTKTVTNLPGSKKQKVPECLDFLVTHFSGDTCVYPGHGPTMMLSELKIF